MKVTALLPDALISEVQSLSRGKNTTDSLLKALQEWIALKHVQKLTGTVRAHPLRFRPGFSAPAIRAANRR